jgi:AcrR family transcriptional regulator
MESFRQFAKARPKRERTRARIMDAATEIAAERGPLASVSEIAERADIAIGTFYNHFESRDELFNAVSVAIADAVTREMEGWHSAGGNSALALSRGLIAFVTILAREPEWGHAFLMVENTYPPPRRERSAQSILRDSIDEGLASGLFSVSSTEFTLYFIEEATRLALRADLSTDGKAGAAQQAAAMVLAILGVPRGEADVISKNAHREVHAFLAVRG